MAEKKKQGPIGMACVKWHMRDGKPWRCARFRPPEKTKATVKTRKQTVKTKPRAPKPKPT